MKKIRLPLLYCFVALALLPKQAFAHPMPSSVLLLDVQARTVQAELQMPLSELGLALKENLMGEPASVLSAHGAELESYLLKHIQPVSSSNPWSVSVDTLTVKEAEQTATGPYQELVVQLTFTPPPGASTRTFTLNYDAVIHQVVTHTILVSVRQDWANGVVAEQQPVEVGVIRINPVDGTVAALEVNLSGGSLRKGFLSMLQLGMAHIAEGTDHLLFLLTLLLPAPLLAAVGGWGKFGGTRYALRTILKIVTAFTVGHSATLILGALMRVHIPSQPIEALIAVSILVSAIHALRPIFPKREMFVAAGFGLIHGMAFSFTLAELNLTTGQMALSLLGFNLGIEVMQLLIIAVTMPWLILLARTPAYTPVRVVGALAALLAALGWLGERLGYTNPLGTLANNLGPYSPWVIVGLAGLALIVFLQQRYLRT
jgi:HupE / UreJ protein